MPHLRGTAFDEIADCTLLALPHLRAFGIAFDENRAVNELRQLAAASFSQRASAHFAHSSLVYDWIGSARVNQSVVATIRRRWPALRAGGSIKASAVALVAMEDATVAQWDILDHIELG